MSNVPFYVFREVSLPGNIVALKVDGWNYREWSGCFCMLSDRPKP